MFDVDVVFADPNQDFFAKIDVRDLIPRTSIYMGGFEELDGQLDGTGCIANAGNSHGIMGAGIAGAIEKRYGSHVKWEARKAISSGDLFQAVGASHVVRLGPNSKTSQFKYCAYTVTMMEPGEKIDPNANVPYRCMLATLAAVDKHNHSHPYRRINTLVVPGFGTGIGGLDPATVGTEMMEAWEDWSKLND